MLRDTSQFSIRIVTPDTVSASEISAWAALEARAIEPNAYLSPYFILPAARHLGPREAVSIFLVERRVAGSHDLAGVAVLTPVRSTLRFPVPRLAGYLSRHSFLSGLLLDRDHPTPTLTALLQHVRTKLPQFKALEIPLVRADGPLAAPGGVAEQAAARGIRRTEPIQRAVLVPSEALAHLNVNTQANRLRDMERRLRRLRERGPVEWRFHRDHGVPVESVEAFLSLEHMGWKGHEGSSLRAKPGDESFFREMVAGFAAQRRAILAEIVLDGTPIASSCNLVSGDAGFAFKIGWNPDLKSFSPGWLNEIEFMRHAQSEFGGLRYIDSGAAPDSFINEIWLARYPLCSLLIPTGATGAAVIEARDRLRNAKRRITGLVSRRAQSSAARKDSPAAR